MSPSENGSERSGSRTFDVRRRRALQLIGTSVVGVATASGTASAHQFQFYGCSQVCSDTDEDRAVVATADGYECRRMDKQNPEHASDRQNQDWSWTSACYEVAEGEAVVGVLEDCEFCVNPNNCASNYYDDVSEIVADLNSGSNCTECSEVTVSSDCDVTGSSGGRGNSGSNGNNGNDGNPGSSWGRRKGR